MWHKKFVLVIVIMFISSGFVSHGVNAKELVGARFPEISPDGTKIAFSYLGDIWVVSTDGGRANRLTDHQAYEREPVWSPDGKWIAFTSNRNGNNDVFIISAEGGEARQLTFHTGQDKATDITPDGLWIIFESGRSSSSSLFKISVRGGNAIPILDTYWSWPYDGKISPDGKTLLFSLGMENRFWWRRGYKGSNSAKIWTKKLQDHQAKLILADQNNCFWPHWSVDGKAIYFVSDRKNGVKNIWSINRDGSGLKAVTSFTEGDVTWLSVSRRRLVAVFERNFGIWKTDLTTGRSEAIPIVAPAELKENSTFFVKNGSVSEFTVSPDGKKIAAVVRGEIFILGEEGGYARNITHTPWRERQVIWDKESKHVIYVSDVDANPDLYRTSALGNRQAERLTNSPEDELKPRLSHDGNWVAYYRGKRQLRLIKPNGRDDRLIYEADFGGWRAGEIHWSPDDRYIAVSLSQHANSDVAAIEVQTGKKIDLTNTAYDETDPAWSPDGKFVLFRSNRFGHQFPEFTGKWDLYKLNLEPEMPEFEEDNFEKLFGNRKKKEEKSVTVSFDLTNIDLQTKTVTNTLGDDGEFILSPRDTTTVYFVSNIDGKRHLWKSSLKEKESGKYEPFMSSVTGLRNLQSDKKGKYLYYLKGGKIGRIDIAGKKNKTISFTSKIQVDKSDDYRQALAELYYTLQYYYYDESHHRINWREIYQKFIPVMEQVREDADFYDYANRMIGYLNSSHTGIHGPGSGIRTEKPSAHFGAGWSVVDNKLILTEIWKDGPLSLHGDSVAVGDELTAVNGQIVNTKENIWPLLNGQLDRRVKLTFRSKKLKRNVLVSLKPVSARAETQLILDEWARQNREIVKKKTDDQIAYIYMRAMGWGDLQRFLKELERDAVPRKGLILDLRYNFGGNVHDRVLQALTTPVYAKWQKRGLSETQQSTFGFANKPVVLLTNEVTLSDGEMTANGFKSLKRGTIVGNRTYGWLIFTTSVGLMNGGSFRLPFWGCYTLDGKDLETIGGVTPDVLVINDLNHDLSNKDPQLDKAIEVIMDKIK